MLHFFESNRGLAISGARAPSARATIGRAVVAAAFCASGPFTPGVASAHIELTEPIARYEVQGETGIKGCPCGIATGGGNSNRTCNVEMDGSDGNRDEARAFTAVAGSSVVLKFKETVGHTGKYRVAFDPEGADFNDFNANVLVEEDDPNGSMGNVENGNNWEIAVTLPDTPCTNCTLQLIQVMDPSTLGGTVDGSKLANMSTYYTCVDLVLTGDEGSTASGGAESAESTADVGSLGSTEVVSSGDVATSTDPMPNTGPVPTGTATPTTSAPITPTPPTVTPPSTPITPTPVPDVTPSASATSTSTSTPTATTTEPAVPPTDEGGDDASCAVNPSRSGSWLGLFTLLGTVALLQRRRARLHG